MQKLRLVSLLAAFISCSSIYADNMHPGRACKTVSDACLNAGYVHGESGNKGIWQNCMKPIITGQAVQGVNVDGGIAQACRKERIEELKNELRELQQNNMQPNNMQQDNMGPNDNMQPDNRPAS